MHSLKPELPARLVLVSIFLVGLACADDPAVDDLRDPPKVITGTIIEIHDEDGEISSMVIESEALALEVRIDRGRDYGFDLNHLYEHLETGDPVRVPIEQRNETLYARAIEDA